jgi:hypothetical protein
MRGRIGRVIGLCLDDPSTDAVDQKRGAEQVAGDLGHFAREIADEIHRPALAAAGAEG